MGDFAESAILGRGQPSQHERLHRLASPQIVDSKVVVIARPQGRAVTSNGLRRVIARSRDSVDYGSREKAARGVAWQTAAQWGSQLLSFGIFTGLARLLTPQAFGLVAIAGVYIAFIQLFVTQGFGTAIIQRLQLEREHLDSAFWIAIATGSLFCLLSLLLAGSIALIFREPRVAPVIGWLSLSLVFYALSSVPTAILTRELNFRPLAVRSLLATGLGGAIGLAMAFLGWGVWSLVGQQLVGAILGCVCLWRAVPWRPRFRISGRHLRDLYGFSLSITGNDILWFFCQRSDQTLVGYGFGPPALGPYSLASRVNNLLVEGITGPLQSVAFPAFSKLQSEPLKLERVLLKFCEMCSLVSFPVFAGMIVIAPELVPWLFGTKWASAVPLLRVLAAYGAARSWLAFVHPVMLAKGRPGLYLSMFIIQACLTFLGCLLAVRWSAEAIALSLVVTMLLFGVFELILVSVRVLGMRPSTLLKAFVFPALSTLLMVTIVALLRGIVRKTYAPAITMAICVAAGVVVYVLTALWVRPDLIRALWEMMRSIFLRVAPRDSTDDSKSSVRDAAIAKTEAL